MDIGSELSPYIGDLIDLGWVLVGFVLLIGGGDALVRGALALAARHKISPLLVGMTVVAMGTSAPELVVSVLSAISGHADIALGNVIGSNIANILLVIGVPVLIYPMATAQPGLARQTNIMMLTSIAFVGLLFFWDDQHPAGSDITSGLGSIPFWCRSWRCGTLRTRRSEGAAW